MTHLATLAGDVPGFAAFTTAGPGAAHLLAERVRAARGGWLVDLDDRSAAVVWGGPERSPEPGPDSSPTETWQVVLGATARTDERALTRADVRRLLGAGDAGSLLAEVIPPFAAAGWRPDDGCVTAVVDWLGFRHVYLATGPGWSGVSSSAAVLGGCVGDGLDRTAVLVQSQLGWQTGGRSLHSGVRKVGAGSRVALRSGGVRETVVVPSAARAEPTDGPPERAAADTVAEVVARFLDDHDDALLQLTGGLDSRILLGAIPRSRRPRVEALTLAVPGSPDAEIAGRLSRAEGMRHRVIDLDGLADLDPGEAHALTAAASRRVEGMADPLALASLLWAERGIGGRPRLAGLGGEVARGFYYFGPAVRLRVRPLLSTGLARWRMFPNESVEADALLPELGSVAPEVAAAEVHHELAAAHRSWWPATDEFYLWQRMQRWAGTLASATAYDRSTVNPMLSRRFIDLARCLGPGEKRSMRYLGRILLETDPALADIELDGRPTPRTYAEPTWANSWRLGRVQAQKVVGKARQRTSRTTRPPAGGEIMAAKVLAHWRADPADLSLLAGILRPDWLDQVVAGDRTPVPSTVALMVNLSQAARGAMDQAGTSVSPQWASAGRVLGRSSARMAVRD